MVKCTVNTNKVLLVVDNYFAQNIVDSCKQKLQIKYFELEQDCILCIADKIDHTNQIGSL